MRKKEEIFISHVLFPWETFAAQAEREQRERKNGGARWTDEFRKEVRKNILRYANTEFFSPDKYGEHAGIMNKAMRNSNLNELYRLVPYHFRSELFAGVSFPLWENR